MNLPAMNIKLHLCIALSLVSATFLVGCNKDLQPEDRIPGPGAFRTLEDMLAWNNGFMSAFRARQLGFYCYWQDVQSDLLNATTQAGETGIASYTWQMTNQDKELSAMWGAYYAGLANLNYFLEHAGDFTPEEGHPGALDTVRHIQGNAHFLRAYYYHELALRWSRTYQPAADCVPLVTTYDVNARPARATQQEVFSFVLAELDKAEKELSDVPNAPSSPTITPGAVQALRARVFLTMQRWNEAYTEATKLIELGAYNLLSDPAKLAKMWHSDASSPEVILMLFASKSGEAPNGMGLYTGFRKTDSSYRPAYLPTQWLVDLYEPTDSRRAIYFTQRTVKLRDDNTATPNVWMVNKYPGNPALVTGENKYLHFPKPLRLAELYLIAAEAAFELNEGAKAQAALNTLRQSRGLGAVSATGDALLQAIKDERTRELAFEGVRLWDLRRWGERCTRQAVQAGDILITTPRELTTGLDVPSEHPKFVWGFPSYDIVANPQLKQNPGW